MKSAVFYFTFILIINFLVTTSYSNQTLVQNELEGIWQGKLKISSVELRIVFNVSKDSAGNYKATLDSPDQGAYGIAVDEVIVKDDSVKFIVKIVQGYFDGILIEDSLMISGNWHQAGMNLELNLYKTDVVEKPNRPQEPKEPFPYKSEEVKFINTEDGDTLAGTLTLPEGEKPFTAVILVTGSGPQDRNEELLSHKPFLVLSDYLTRNGFAVLRYDDRGIGESTGDFRSATTEDLAEDALAAVEFLKTRNEINKIGIAGHSEGGLIAPMVAVESDDVDFIVMMAGPGIRGDSILILQTELIYRANNTSEEEIKKTVASSKKIYNIILNENDSAAADLKIRQVLEEAYNQLSDDEKNQTGPKDSYIDMSVRTMLSPWFRYFVKYDPYPTLIKVKCPVLAINGEKDLQVPPKENLSAIGQVLKEGGNKNYKVVEMPGLNHLFQNCETGSPLEYGKIEETFSEDAMKVISDWILEVTK